MLKHYTISVKGKVQGVYYRQSVLEVARQIGINGFIKNELNGDVLIEAEGKEEELNKLIEWCKKGPDKAIVTAITLTEEELKNFSEFKIL